MATIKYNSIPEMFQKQAEKYGDKACTAYKKGDAYVDVSWSVMNKMVKNLAAFLIRKGVQPQDKVALFSQNRYEWWVVDQAILIIGAVNVPIYATNSAEETRYALDHSDSKICITGAPEHLANALTAWNKLDNLGFIIAMDGDISGLEKVFSFAEITSTEASAHELDEIDKRLGNIKKDDLATIMYTSGTSGPPKGVMLTHSNFLANLRQINAETTGLITDSDVFLSFLPLSHSLERTCGYYIPMSNGAKVAFAVDFPSVPQNLTEVRPSLMVSVPRLYEKAHASILSKVSSAPPIKKTLFAWAMGLAKKNLPYVCESKAPTGLFKFQLGIAEKLIFSKLRAAMGFDNLKFAVSGGGPLSVYDAEFFLGMGIRIIEGFGLTETTPVTNVNRPAFIKPGTVGPPVIDTEVKIADDGELLIKGPQIMKGYYMNQEATDKTFTSDGFFKTGDIGAIDSDDYLSITGRKKEIIITSGGKNISPQNIENAVKASRYIEQIALIGDNRKYLAALIVPSFEEVEVWAEDNNITFTDNQELVENPQVLELFKTEIDNYTTDFSRVEQIRKFTLLPNEWLQQTGELTPTLKLKRKIVMEKYSQEIENMFPK